MPKTDINKILKNGDKTKIKTVDYSTPAAKKKLATLKKQSEKCLKNKEVSDYRLSQIIINK